MLTYDEFCSCIRESIPRFQHQWVNDRQEQSISADPNPPLFIVAGPGTGKTTVLALRTIKLVLVDGIPPDSIIATTFTRKAASELRSRILSWGYATLKKAQDKFREDNDILNWLNTIDFNGTKTGTLDSLAEEMISEDRQPGEISPTLIEKVAVYSLLRKNALFVNGRYNNADLINHLRVLSPHSNINTMNQKLSVCESFCSRVHYDNINLEEYRQNSTGHSMLVDIVNDYCGHIVDKNYMDYALLEATLLQKLRSGRLVSTTERLRALLIDEFQDTNYLQEQIYYELCRRSNASLTVVGDDDQSMYRFRGATVEIFASFEQRIREHLGNEWSPRRKDLVKNYRSTEKIVQFFNAFAFGEPDYQEARVPGKDSVIAASDWATNPDINIPILGMFRDNVDLLAEELGTLLISVFREAGYSIDLNGETHLIRCNEHGDFGDAVLLGRTVAEYNSTGKPRLPLLLRNKLAQEGIDVFNPRGRGLTAILEVSQLLGLMLMCIDPNGTIRQDLRLSGAVHRSFQEWLHNASVFIHTNPHPGGLGEYVTNWGSRRPESGTWPSEWPLLELMFSLITWFPLFQENPEGQVYLEAIARAISEAGQVSAYKSLILYGNPPYDSGSVKDAIREIFSPLAEGIIEVNEEIMPYVPRNYLPIMTIHQAKGLEFPLVILDVGSDYKTNNARQRQFRFPDGGDNVHFLEDNIAAVSPVGPARLTRGHRQRAFDDIRRQYYVAKSRPQQVLILVGLTTMLRPNTSIRSIALGDLIDGSPKLFNFKYPAEYTEMDPPGTIVLI